MALLALDGSGRAATCSWCRPAPRSRRQRPARHRLGDAYASGGLDAEREAVEGFFGITTSLSEDVDVAAGRAAGAVRAVHVTLDPRPRYRRQRAVGGADRPAPSISTPTRCPAPRRPRRERERGGLANRTAAVWTPCWRGRSRRRRRWLDGFTGGGRGPPATVTDQLAAIAHGRARCGRSGAPVLDAVANPRASTSSRPTTRRRSCSLAQTMPGAISPANDNIRLQVVNATGDPTLLADASPGSWPPVPTW